MVQVAIFFQHTLTQQRLLQAIYGIAIINITAEIPYGLFPQVLASLRMYSVLANKFMHYVYDSKIVKMYRINNSQTGSQ